MRSRTLSSSVPSNLLFVRSPRSLNSLQKIYVFLWFWLVLLAIITTYILFYRLTVIFFPNVRLSLLKRRAKFVDKQSIHELLQNTDLGDWFLLMQIGKNVDVINYRDILEQLRISLRYSSDHSSELQPLKAGIDEPPQKS